MFETQDTNIAHRLTSFLYEGVMELSERPLRSFLVVTAPTFVGCLIGYILGYTETYRKIVRPRVCLIRARDRERTKRYLVHTISMETTLNKQAGRWRSDIKNDNLGESATHAFGYYSLPPEIRNMIMWYALGAGSVHLPQIREVMDLPHEFSGNPPRVLSAITRLRNYFNSIRDQRAYYGGWNRQFEIRPPYEPEKRIPTAVGLLASSRKVYQESHGIYWSSNTFHLARGSFKHSEMFFSIISPAHIALINSIVINLTIADLDPSLLRFLEQFTRDVGNGLLPWNNDHDNWAHLAAAMLHTEWTGKLNWASKSFGHVAVVHITCFDAGKSAVRMSGSKFAKTMQDPEELQACTELLWLLFLAHRRALSVVGQWVRAFGWENFKEWLLGKCRLHENGERCPLHD